MSHVTLSHVTRPCDMSDTSLIANVWLWLMVAGSGVGLWQQLQELPGGCGGAQGGCNQGLGTVKGEER